VPLEVDLVVKKGSKIWVHVASSIPTPSSRTKNSMASMRRTMPLRDTSPTIEPLALEGL